MAAASVAVTMFAGFALSANAAGGEWVGYTEATDGKAHWNYGVGHELTTTSTGTYDPTTGTLTFEKDTKLYGCENDNKSYYGNSIISVENTDLTLDLNSFNVTLDSTNLNEIEGGYDYIYGLYKVGGTLTIQGPGTLNITASGGSKESVALRAHDGADIKITGGAQVNVTDNDDNGYGLFAAGNVDVIDGLLTMTGGAAALDFASNDTANIDIFHKEITAGDNAYDTITWTVTDAGESAKELEKYKYVRIEPAEAPDTSVTVGGTTLKNGQTYTSDNVTAVYDSWTSTLTLSGLGTINGLTGDTSGAYGAAIWASSAITINVADDADITLQGGASANNSYSYGIFSSSGTLTITGGGKLTVKSADSQTTYPSAAVYTGDNITISGSVKVTANGLGSNHLAVNNTKSSGTITIPDGSIAELHMINEKIDAATKLFNGSLVYPDGYLANALDKNDEDIQLGSPADQYSEYHIKPNELSGISETEYIGAFYGDNADGTENDEDAATAFLTTIKPKGSVTISALSWTVTSQGESQTLFPKNFATLELNSEAKIGVIVKGLYDSAATAEAYVYGSVNNAAN